MTRISLQRLKNEAVEADIRLQPDYLNEGCDPPLDIDPCTGLVTFRLYHQEVTATGLLKSRIRCQCVRCLGQIEVPLEAQVQLFYWPESRAEAQRGMDIQMDDPDYGVYRGEFIEPDEDLRELILLEIPQAPHCPAPCMETELPEVEIEEEAPKPSTPEWKRKLRDIRLD